MTNAVPFGIYLAPVEIIRADIRERVSDGEQCYIQLIKRISSQSYSVHAAASSADLQRIYRDEEDESAADRVLVSTISRQDLHMQCSLLSAPSVEQPLYAAPDCVLKDKYLSDGKALQLCAASAWLCYFRVLHVLDDGSVRVRVAALPHRVDGTVGRSYFTTLSREEFALALPLESGDLNLATCDLREKVEAKAQTVLRRPVEHIHPQVLLDEQQDNSAAQQKPAYPPEVLKMLRPVPVDLPISGRYDEEEMLPEAQRPDTEKLEPVFIPDAIATYAVERFKATTGRAPTSRKLEQKVWLQASLLALRSYKEQAQEQHVKEAIDQQDQRVRTVLVNWLSSSVLLVEAVPVVVKRGKRASSGYVVRIEEPIEQPLVAA